MGSISWKTKEQLEEAQQPKPTETELLKQENAELKAKLENVGSRLESVEMATITLMDFM